MHKHTGKCLLISGDDTCTLSDFGSAGYVATRRGLSCPPLNSTPEFGKHMDPPSNGSLGSSSSSASIWCVRALELWNSTNELMQPRTASRRLSFVMWRCGKRNRNKNRQRNRRSKSRSRSTGKKHRNRTRKGKKTGRGGESAKVASRAGLRQPHSCDKDATCQTQSFCQGAGKDEIVPVFQCVLPFLFRGLLLQSLLLQLRLQQLS